MSLSTAQTCNIIPVAAAAVIPPFTVNYTTTGNVTEPQSVVVDTRSPLEQTLDVLLLAAEDLARAFRAHHDAMTEPLT